MFQPWKSDNGAVLPWEYLPAEAGTYHVGQALNLDATTGHLEAVAADLDTTPPYICNAEVKVETAGTPIPVSRTSRDVIYETTLQAAAAGTVAGSRLVVKSGGTQVGAGDGTFEVVSLDGTTAGSIVRGRSWTRSPRRAAVANHRPARERRNKTMPIRLTFSEGSGLNDSVYGKCQAPIRMFLEKRGEAFEQESSRGAAVPDGYIRELRRPADQHDRHGGL